MQNNKFVIAKKLQCGETSIGFFIPFIILFALTFLLLYALFFSKPNEIPSALINEKLPAFELATLPRSNQKFTPKDLQGQVTLLNIWATWCYACEIEHPMLMKIKQQYHIPIYSIAYKDDPVAVMRWLADHGNPFVLTGDDHDGNVAIDLGVYGTPETFIISPDGKIIYRHTGAINQQTWDNVLYPIIQKNRATNPKP